MHETSSFLHFLINLIKQLTEPVIWRLIPLLNPNVAAPTFKQSQTSSQPQRIRRRYEAIFRYFFLFPGPAKKYQTPVKKSKGNGRGRQRG